MFPKDKRCVSFQLLSYYDDYHVVCCVQCRVFPATLPDTPQAASFQPSASVRRVLTTSTRIGSAWTRATVVPVSTTNSIQMCRSPRAGVLVSVVEHLKTLLHAHRILLKLPTKH